MPADCAGDEAGLELVTLGDFSPVGSVATNWYVYIDKSGTGKISSFDKGWQASTVSDPFPRCGQPSNALHIQGGLFLGWGGGFGTAAANWLLYPQDPHFNCPADSDVSLCPPSNTPTYLNGALVDASAYEGVALWARRGPDSQGGIRINVGDQNTDDDISYLTYQFDPTIPRNCERVRECACTNHKACSKWASSPLDTTAYPQFASWACPPGASDTSHCASSSNSQTCATPGPYYYCEDPSSGIVPGYNATSAPDTACNTCDVTNCNLPYPAYPGGPPFASSAGGAASTGQYDAQYYNRPCTPYTMRSGLSTSYCFDPATDPPPAESDQQCGDHWITPIYLTNQWALYLVPFTTMQQQGFGKKFGKMDLHAVTMVRLTWDGGYVDYWIGKVAFYRHKS
jgi:hypothetical protein